MVEHQVVGLTALLVLGIAAQWLSWRLKLPAILLLLVTGIVTGSITGALNPDQLLGDLLFPIVSLSVAVILFEGGLTLRIVELKSIGRVVRNLIVIGVPVTWTLTAVAARFFLEFSVELSILLGALLVVTGPTVIIPLLRHVRPAPRVGTAARWEGIVNDPIGAILAVLVFEVIILGGLEQGILPALAGIMRSLLAGSVLGAASAGVVIIMLKRYLVPDFLQSSATLALVIAAFTAANQIQDESGLLAVTVMGGLLGSQKIVSIQHIIEFKENLRVLLIASLFILLAARLPISDPVLTNAGSLLFVAALIVVVRPVTILLSTLGTNLSWPERVFLGFMAPRGIVAAAVSALFAIKLAEKGFADAGAVSSVTFLVIILTVAFYGLTAGPVAKRLGVANPNPKGILIVGASRWVRQMAKCLVQNGIDVTIADSNPHTVWRAAKDGIRASRANILSDQVLEELDLTTAGYFMALTPNDEVNSLAVLHFAEVFDTRNRFQVSPADLAEGTDTPRHLRGRVLFARDATFANIADRSEAGAGIQEITLTDEYDFDNFVSQYGEDALPMFYIDQEGELSIFSADQEPKPKPRGKIICMMRGENK